MRLLWKAVRAVTVETLGVVAVVWMLFAGAGLTVQDSLPQTPVISGGALDWAQGVAGDLAHALRPELERHDRERYVEESLSRYSGMYREAAADYIDRTANHLTREVTAHPGMDDSANAGNLFGSL